MPEGPSIVMYREELLPFVGKKVKDAGGNIKTVDPTLPKGHKLTDIQTWGKYLFLLFDKKLVLRMHFGMFGTYRINEEREGKAPKLSLHFADGSYVHFYAISMRYPEGPPAAPEHDPRADVMNAAWDDKLALKKVKALPAGTMICDAILDQKIFAGAGNIFKNEVLYRTKVQPESLVSAIPARRLKAIVEGVADYGEDFLRWRRKGVLRKNWEAHNKKICPRCKQPFIKDYTGVLKRRSFWCEVDQELFG